MRNLFTTAATPVAQDRFFFTDENQTGDPIRHVTFNDLQSALAVPIIITNIASYDAAQNRFEDSGGNAVSIPNNAEVYLTQAVYNAAVADADFTPNANATFYSRA